MRISLPTPTTLTASLVIQPANKTSYVAATADEDKLDLNVYLCIVLGVTPHDWSRGHSNYKKALRANGIEGLTDFISLKGTDVDELSWQSGGQTFTLNVTQSTRLRAAIHFYHHASRENQAALDPKTLTKDAYDTFRIGVYNPDAKVIPWHIPLKSEGVKQWEKGIKRSADAHNKLNDGAHFPKWFDHTLSTLKSQALEHLTDPNYVVSDNDLYAKETDWFYNILDSKVKQPRMQDIIRGHKQDKCIPDIWRELVETYENSVSYINQKADLQKVITGSDFADGSFRGSNTAQLANWRRQVLDYNEISKKAPITDEQAMEYLKMAVRNVPALANVHTQYMTSCIASGGSATGLDFNTYVELLDQAAQELDTNDKVRNSRRVNVCERDIEAIQDQQEYEACVHDLYHGTEDEHDADTPPHVLLACKHQRTGAYQTQFKSPPPRMDAASFAKLSPELKEEFRKLSPELKAILLKAKTETQPFQGTQAPRGQAGDRGKTGQRGLKALNGQETPAASRCTS